MDDKFWAEFEAALGAGTEKVIPPPGKGWFSLAEYAKRFKINPTTARQRLGRMVAGGKLERQRCVGNNPARPVFYRVVAS